MVDVCVCVLGDIIGDEIPAGAEIEERVRQLIGKAVHDPDGGRDGVCVAVCYWRYRSNCHTGLSKLRRARAAAAAGTATLVKSRG